MLLLNLLLASSAALVSAAAVDNMTECLSTASLDLIFVLDASGSVYDDGYDHWQAELDFAALIVANSLPLDMRVSTILFSGCGANKDFVQCEAEGKFQKLWSLDTFGEPNDVSAVYGAFGALNGSDFLGGYTWTDEALAMALSEFEEKSAVERSKMIVLVTDGEPFPQDQGHEPCVESTGYVSPTLRALRQLGVYIVAAGVNVTHSAIDDVFSCVVDDFERDFFLADDFGSLYDLNEEVGELVCSDREDIAPLSSTTTTTLTPSEPCDSSLSLDLIFILDASGSVYDDGYENWQAELDFAALIVANSLPSDTRVAAIVFGGCGADTTLADCEEKGKLRLLWGLEQGAASDALEAFSALDSSDFTGGYTWTREALEMALLEFEAASSASRGKRIILLSDGEPFPQNQGHEVCVSSTGYVSSTLSALQSMGVHIIGVGIDVEDSTIEEYFSCTVSSSDTEENFFYAEDFSAVRGLAEEVGEVVCFEDVSMPTTTRLTTTESDSTESGYDAECDSTDSLDVVFLLDASGSVYDEFYENWQAELDLARLIVERALPLDSRVSLTVFSGCANSKNFTQCADLGHFEQKFALDEYSELADVSDAIAAMGSADFTGGFTWTDEALAMALSEFEANSAADRPKAVVLVTDGEPYPSNAGHAPCQASTGYVSETTMALRAMDVSMIAVGIDLAQSTIDEFFSCVVDEFLSAQDFAALNALTGDIRELLCTDDDVSFDDEEEEENPNTAREVSRRSALLFLSVFLALSL